MNNITHKIVTLSYKLYTLDNGTSHLEEETSEGQPLQIMTGFGMTLPDFEKNIMPLSTDEDFDFILTPEQAYGEYDESHVIEVDRSVFTINNHFDHEHIYVGAIVPLQNADGNRFLGHIENVGDEKVTVNLNHPPAGKTLNFKGTILLSREATDEEVQTFINRMNSHSCGCGCDECGGHCGDDCGDDCGSHCSCGNH